MLSAESLGVVVRLLAVGDTAFPVGGFSFSDGLESAVACGVVSDAATLGDYAHTTLRQMATTDGIAAITAHRAARNGDFEALQRADRALHNFKTLAEARLKTLRMGRRLAELAARIAPSHLTSEWNTLLQHAHTEGTYAVSLAVLCASAGIAEREMFGVLVFGSLATVLGAALRLLRVSHFESQRLMFDLADSADALYDMARVRSLDEMSGFAPEVEILSALHERGFSRMFMN